MKLNKIKQGIITAIPLDKNECDELWVVKGIEGSEGNWICIETKRGECFCKIVKSKTQEELMEEYKNIKAGLSGNDRSKRKKH